MNNMMIGIENGAKHKTKEEEKAVKKSETAAIKSSQTDKSDKKAPAEKKKKLKRGIKRIINMYSC